MTAVLLARSVEANRRARELQRAQRQLEHQISGVEAGETFVVFLSTMAVLSGAAGSSEEDKYEGDWSGDTRQGQGKCQFANGDCYDGAWQSDVREGVGDLTYANGDSYSGEWHTDMRWGKGSQQYAGGETYEGAWLNDVRHGDGSAHVLGDKYEGGVADYTGAWLDDLMSGEGYIVYGTSHRTRAISWMAIGTARVGTKTPKGSCTRATGLGTFGRPGLQTWPSEGDAQDTYEGEWEDDQRCGEGVMKYANGDVYEGNWGPGGQFGVRCGQGRCTYANGDVYEGEWQNDMRCGIGICSFANGDVYEGEFADDGQDGEGICKYQNGDVYTGMWARGKRNGEGECSTAILTLVWHAVLLSRRVER